ncbi:hypothetical protein KCP75_24940 [Salmonella enterica subsp. enterica]|nr:hypothetical protein KCP75_24940 [Salmonella enterica subsp. enterica]
MQSSSLQNGGRLRVITFTPLTRGGTGGNRISAVSSVRTTFWRIAHSVADWRACRSWCAAHAIVSRKLLAPIRQI